MSIETTPNTTPPSVPESEELRAWVVEWELPQAEEPADPPVVKFPTPKPAPPAVRYDLD
jgi:hypothetical protein